MTLLCVFPVSAYAYLDPGTGAMIIQAVVAVFAGIAFFVKSNWQKIRGLKSGENKLDQESDASEVKDDSDETINKAS